MKTLIWEWEQHVSFPVYLDKNNLTLLYCLVPTPVTSLLVTDVSTNTTTVNWTSPSSRNGNYVT